MQTSQVVDPDLDMSAEQVEHLKRCGREAQKALVLAGRDDIPLELLGVHDGDNPTFLMALHVILMAHEDSGVNYQSIGV